MAQLIQNGDVLSGTSNDSANILYSEPDGSNKNVQEKIGELENEVDGLNNNLTANNQLFKYAYQDGKYGYIAEVEGADTFFPFSGDFPQYVIASIRRHGNDCAAYTLDTKNAQGTFQYSSNTTTYDAFTVTTDVYTCVVTALKNIQISTNGTSYSELTEGQSVTLNNGVNTNGYACIKVDY